MYPVHCDVLHRSLSVRMCNYLLQSLWGFTTIMVPVLFAVISVSFITLCPRWQKCAQIQMKKL